MNYRAKKLISENLENWFTMDHILFGGIPESYLSKPIYEQYLQLKKTYLASLFEMYNFVGYTSKYKDAPKSRSQIEIMALESARISKKRSSAFLISESKKFSKIITESKNQDVSLKKLQLSCQMESAFISNQMKHASRPNNFESPKYILLKNCLTECKKELIGLSLKYFK